MGLCPNCYSQSVGFGQSTHFGVQSQLLFLFAAAIICGAGKGLQEPAKAWVWGV